MKTLEPNYELMLRSAVSYLQEADKEYKRLKTKFANCYWIDNEGHVCYLKGEPQYLAEKMAETERNLEYAKANVIVLQEKMREKGLMV